MEQRTCNIIMCCKGHCKISECVFPLEAVVAYMSKECDCPKETYNERTVEWIMRDALFDYFKSVDNPSFELRQLLYEYPTINPSLSERIATMFQLTRVRDDKGYVNGFSDELLKQSEIDLGNPQEEIWHDLETDPPKQPGLYYGAQDGSNSMYAVRYNDGKWTLSAYPEQEIKIVRWAHFDAFYQIKEEE